MPLARDYQPRVGRPSYWTSAWSTRASSSYGWEYLYASYRYDLESGMYQVRNRYLHPNLGRWISRDPLGEIGFEPSSQIMELDAMGDDTNLYAYVRNNPTNYIDLSGLGFDFSKSGCPSFILPMIQSQFAAVCQTAIANNCCPTHLRSKGAQNMLDLCNGTHTRNTVKVKCRWNCKNYCGETKGNTVYICLSTRLPNPGNVAGPDPCYQSNPWGCTLFHEATHAEGGVGPDGIWVGPPNNRRTWPDNRGHAVTACAGCVLK